MKVSEELKGKTPHVDFYEDLRICLEEAKGQILRVQRELDSLQNERLTNCVGSYAHSSVGEYSSNSETLAPVHAVDFLDLDWIKEENDESSPRDSYLDLNFGIAVSGLGTEIDNSLFIVPKIFDEIRVETLDEFRRRKRHIDRNQSKNLIFLSWRREPTDRDRDEFRVFFEHLLETCVARLLLRYSTDPELFSKIRSAKASIEKVKNFNRGLLAYFAALNYDEGRRKISEWKIFESLEGKLRYVCAFCVTNIRIRGGSFNRAALTTRTCIRDVLGRAHNHFRGQHRCRFPSQPIAEFPASLCSKFDESMSFGRAMSLLLAAHFPRSTTN